MPNRPSRTIVAVLAVVMALLLVPSIAVAGKSKSKSKTRRVTAAEQMAFGVDMAKRGLWREALFRFQRARQLDADTPQVLNNLAVAFEAVGDFEQALEHYKLALAAAPSNRDLKKNYARFVEFYQSFRPPQEPEEAADEDRSEGTESADG